MTPSEFKRTRLMLGLTQLQFSRVLKTDIRQIQRWESGDSRITGPTSIAVALLCEIAGTEIAAKYIDDVISDSLSGNAENLL